ncbi:MAG: hypothetical protein V1492_00680 [Candidatus Micrarchaeota archaeon]
MAQAGVVRTHPEPYKAVYALETAKEFIKNAEEDMLRNDYNSAYGNSLHAMRMASSAVMFLDGYIAQTLDSATYYLKEKYVQLPADEWRQIELDDPTKRGLADRFAEALGRKKYDERQASARAVAVAREFVISVEKMVLMGSLAINEPYYRFE